MTRVKLLNQSRAVSATRSVSRKLVKKQHELQAEIMLFIENMPFSLDQRTSKPTKLAIPDHDVEDGGDEGGWALIASDDKDDEGEDDEEEEEEDLENNVVEMASHPEDAALPLPSHLGRSHFNNADIRALAVEETELRVKQASGALQQLQLALGLKSAFVKNRIRGANTQYTKTRAWRAFKPVQAAVICHKQDYRIARQALVDLGAPAVTLARFPVLKREDCKMGGDIEEENRVGQRSDHVSWIWRVDSGESSDKDQWQ
jgi:hypothetical protein